MPLTMDFSADYELWDFTEAVTLRRRSKTAVADRPVATALRAQPSQRERAPSNGIYAGTDLAWHLPGPLLSSAHPPRPGDQVLDAAEIVWTILSLDFDQADQVWRLYTLDLTLFHGLRDSGTFYGPDPSADNKDSAGSYVPAPIAVHSEVVCRLQELDTQPVEERGRRGELKRFVLYLAEDLDLQADYYFEDAEGRKFDVVSWRNKESIADVQTVDLELRP